MSRTHRSSTGQHPATQKTRTGQVRTAAMAMAIAGVAVVGLLTGGLATERTADSPSSSTAFPAWGTTDVGGVVVDGAHVDMGVVPLDVTVVPTWTLTNTTTDSIAFGDPHASVIEGCCPGPLVLGDTVLAAGESTRLAFPLQMHAGMDGPHDFDVHVPIAGTDTYLTLRVTGDFRG